MGKLEPVKNLTSESKIDPKDSEKIFSQKLTNKMVKRSSSNTKLKNPYDMSDDGMEARSIQSNRLPP